MLVLLQSSDETSRNVEYTTYHRKSVAISVLYKPPFRRSTYVAKTCDQISEIRTNTKSTNYILYRDVAIKWLRDAHGALANLIQGTQNVYL